MIDLQAYVQQHFNLTLSDAQAAAFDVYLHELLDWNTRVNLTAITDPQQVIVRHFLDSLSVASVITFEAGDKLVDVGTGAGFPGLALAIAFPQINVTLLEATAKKLIFCQHIVDLLKLRNVRTVHARAEEAGQMPQHRAQYDVVTARAVARLPILLEYTLPLAKVNGLVVALKGATAQTEVDDSAAALAALGGQVQPIVHVPLPGVDDPHYLVTTIKVKSTPGRYPRSAGKPVKEPIGAPPAPPKPKA
ncbi:16S rRNA (guanine(527)-N(7))-methyltransferase RsmG [Aggregatilineales bacterium SYSU G02658]